MPSYLSAAADLLMILASTGAAIYCLILSRRLSRLTSFDKGIGGAIAVLSAQVDEMKAALGEAKAGTEGVGAELRELVRQARDISGELELMIAACHDFAEEALVVQTSGATGGAAAELAPVPEPSPAREPEPVALREAPMVAPEPLPSGAPVGSAAEETAPPTPVFGTRRMAAQAPVFRRHAQG